MFSCYTGLAYIDVMSLTPENITVGIDGEKWIYTQRKKTDEKVRMPLLPIAKAIIEKYKSSPQILNTGKILPSISNQRLNSYLKEIADVCGIQKNLTFHLAILHCYSLLLAYFYNFGGVSVPMKKRNLRQLIHCFFPKLRISCQEHLTGA